MITLDKRKDNSMIQIMDLSKINIIKKIEEGTYGIVYLVNYKNKEVVLKLYKKINKFTINEINFYEYKDKYIGLHDNILNSIGYIKESNDLGLILEYCDFDLLEVINWRTTNKIKLKNISPINYNTIIKIIEGIKEGIKILHKNYIAHLDIKPENILIKINNNNDIIPKICDFGHAIYFKNIIMYKINILYGTPNYIAPEVLNNKYFNYSADIYSFGKTCLYLINNYNYTIPLWIYKCLEVEPLKRPYIDQININEKISGCRIIYSRMYNLLKYIYNR